MYMLILRVHAQHAVHSHTLERLGASKKAILVGRVLLPLECLVGAKQPNAYVCWLNFFKSMHMVCCNLPAQKQADVKVLKIS